MSLTGTVITPGSRFLFLAVDNLLPLIKEGKIASDITVTVRYKDLNLNPLEHNWEINPRIYEGIRNVDYSGITDVVDVLERKLADGGTGNNIREDGTQEKK